MPTSSQTNAHKPKNMKQNQNTNKKADAPAEVREVNEHEWNDASAIAQDRVRLGRLRNYLLPQLAQEAKNIARAAAYSISDFEAMKRSKGNAASYRIRGGRIT